MRTSERSRPHAVMVSILAARVPVVVPTHVLFCRCPRANRRRLPCCGFCGPALMHAHVSVNAAARRSTVQASTSRASHTWLSQVSDRRREMSVDATASEGRRWMRSPSGSDPVGA